MFVDFVVVGLEPNSFFVVVGREDDFGPSDGVEVGAFLGGAGFGSEVNDAAVGGALISLDSDADDTAFGDGVGGV